jgi:hypothetical protein
MTVFTTAVHVLSEINQYSPFNLVFPRSILILSSHLRLGLPSCLCPSGISSKIVYAFLIFLIHATCPAHLILLDLITVIIFDEAYKL